MKLVINYDDVAFALDYVGDTFTTVEFNDILRSEYGDVMYDGKRGLHAAHLILCEFENSGDVRRLHGQKESSEHNINHTYEIQ